MKPHNQAKFEAVFLLAGMTHTDVFPIENGYCGNTCCPDKPWFLFRTEFGLIKIGWRKRVIDIDWSDTPYRGRVTDDDVTHEDNYVHAWGYGHAVTYLSNLQDCLRRKRRDDLRAEEASTKAEGGSR